MNRSFSAAGHEQSKNGSFIRITDAAPEYNMFLSENVEDRTGDKNVVSPQDMTWIYPFYKKRCGLLRKQLEKPKKSDMVMFNE